MRENMDNAGLSIELFAKRMNISRSMLYRKIKSVTGLTPVEFMHRVRIAYAIELLRGDYNFSQIAYMTGFNDPKYFTKCFQALHGHDAPVTGRRNGRPRATRRTRKSCHTTTVTSLPTTSARTLLLDLPFRRLDVDVDERPFAQELAQPLLHGACGLV